ncbi:MlaD family protein [Nonomuraea sp. NPDC050310]|uniref:MlaD family protein n=1 Tax=Nonomuraea sp. NPDC050310 TaxID=3154935 RepID=UPI0033DFB9FD
MNRLKLLLLALVTVAAGAYTAVEYAELVPRGYRVGVELAEAGGLYERAEVTYRGVPVGRVEALEVTADGVRATLRLEAPVPKAGVRAVVANRSGVGEQYLDLQPTGAAPPYLEEGAVIGRERTRLPVSTAKLLGDAEALLASVDPHDVGTVVTELERAIGGPELRRLIEAGSEVVDAAAEVAPETVALIRDGETVLETQRGFGWKEFSRDLAEFTEAVETGAVNRVIDGAVLVSPPVGGMVDDVQPFLRPLVRNAVIGGQVFSARESALRQLLLGYPAGVAGAFTVVGEDGLHFGLNLNLNVPPPCKEGYGTPWRRPQDLSVRPAVPDSHCRAPAGGATGVRGARNVPEAGPTPGIPGLREWLGDYDPVTWPDGS